MAQVIISLVHVCQAAFASYNLYVASFAISNLQNYEEKSKKAAEYSNVAEHQLHKTRTTQASGTIAVLASLLSSATLLLFPSWSRSYVEVLMAGVNVAALLAARVHIGNFWKGKAKVPLPGVGKYNDAVSRTQTVRLNILYLAASWVVGGFLSLVL